MNYLLRKIQIFLAVFSRVTTSVAIVTAIYIAVFWGKNTQVSAVEILSQILLVSGICAIGSSIFPDGNQKEISKISMLIKGICYYIFVNAVVLGFGVYFEWFYLSNWKMVTGMVISIAIVFVLVTALCYWNDIKTAEKMNEKLKEREKNLD